MPTAQQTLDAVPGLTYRMLDHWITCGYLPGVAVSPGSGFRRQFTDDTVERIRVMVTLTTVFGIRASRAAELVDLLLEHRSIGSGRVIIRLEDATP